MAHPVRTCAGCRGRAAKHDLLRIVWGGDALLADPRQVVSGRGAYLHVDQGCLELAIRRRALARALRVTGQGLDPDAIRALLGPLFEPAQR